MSWMEDNTVSDVQSAIFSQTIQTALESNTSAISDAGFQSYLTNAPIPRFYTNPTAGTALALNTETVLAYAAAGVVFDQYLMSIGTNQFRIPVDGFYTVQTALAFVQPNAAGSYQYYIAVKMVTGSFGAGQYLGINGPIGTLYGATPTVYCPLSITKPFRAGDVFEIRGFQSGMVAGVTTEIGNNVAGLSIVWHAPYVQYQAGGN